MDRKRDTDIFVREEVAEVQQRRVGLGRHAEVGLVQRRHILEYVKLERQRHVGQQEV